MNRWRCGGDGDGGGDDGGGVGAWCWWDRWHCWWHRWCMMLVVAVAAAVNVLLHLPMALHPIHLSDLLKHIFDI